MTASAVWPAGWGCPAALANNSNGARCRALRCAAQVAPAASGLGQPLADARPLPIRFSNPAAVFGAEGPAFHFLFRLIRNAHALAPCFGHPEAALALPPGWLVAAAPAENLWVVRSPAAGQLVVLAAGLNDPHRGWARDFSYNQARRRAGGDLASAHLRRQCRAGLKRRGYGPPPHRCLIVTCCRLLRTRAVCSRPGAAAVVRHGWRTLGHSTAVQRDLASRAGSPG